VREVRVGLGEVGEQPHDRGQRHVLTAALGRHTQPREARLDERAQVLARWHRLPLPLRLALGGRIEERLEAAAQVGVGGGCARIRSFDRSAGCGLAGHPGRLRSPRAGPQARVAP